MTGLNDFNSDTAYKKDIAEAIRMVNENHDKAVEKQRREAETSPLKLRMQKIISRISGDPIKSKCYSRHTVIYFYNDNNEKYLIKMSSGELIGTLKINNKINTKIELVNNRPVFVVSRNNEVYFKKDLITGEVLEKSIGREGFNATVRASVESQGMIQKTKEIYELIENKDYDAIDYYLSWGMEQLITNNDIDATQKDKRDAYIKIQVLYRNAQKLKSSLVSTIDVNDAYLETFNQLDVLYRQMCEILINAGYYHMPKMVNDEEEKITRH